MSEPNVLVNFRLQDTPLRVKWLATDGVPGDGYKPQITAIRLDDGTTLQMDSSAIVEQTAPDPAGGMGGYMVRFSGIVGFAADHPDRARIDRIGDAEIDYDIAFVTDDGRVAIENQDYKIVDRPRGAVHNLSKKS